MLAELYSVVSGFVNRINISARMSRQIFYGGYLFRNGYSASMP
jgi:hypothetical protein